MTRRNININIEIDKDGDYWVGFVREFPVSDYGSTISEAFARTVDAAMAWIKANAAAGQMEKMSKEYKFAIVDEEDIDSQAVAPRAVFQHKVLVPA